MAVPVAAAPAQAGLKQWCEEEQLLGSLYGFAHLDCSSLQSHLHINGFLAIVDRFVARLEQDARLSKGGQPADAEAAAQLLWPGQQLADVAALCSAVSLLRKDDSVQWFGHYGCVLLPLPAGGGDDDVAAVPGQLALTLVGLDEWRFSLHLKASTAGSTCQPQHTSSAGDAALLCCGTLPAAQYPDFKSALRKLLARAQNRKKEDRSAAGGRQGHQHTPALIAALVAQALEKMAEDTAADHVPKGGFTDVGMHTGGRQRDTAWPLVWEALKAVLTLVPSCHGVTPGLAAPALAHLHLWLLQRQVALVTPEGATSRMLSATIRMLEVTAHAAAKLALAGADVAALEGGCATARAALDAAACTRQRNLADATRLPPLEGPGAPCGPSSFRSPLGVIPAEALPQRDDAIRQQQVLERAAANLGSLPVSPAPPAGHRHLPFTQLLGLLRHLAQHTTQRGDVAVLGVLCAAERHLFALAADGFGGEGQAPAEAEVAALVEAVELYRKVLHGWQAGAQAAARLQAELRSRVALVAWVALCVAHAAALQGHPLLQEYGLGLAWEDLRHLVLSDMAATDALLAVAAYVRRHTRPGMAVFTLADGGAATFELARRFATADARLCSLWQAEQAAAAQRVAAHWEAVQQKQRVVKKLRQRLSEETEQEARARRKLHSARLELSFGSDDDYYISRLERVLRDAVNRRKATERQLQHELVPPEPVVQPLPRGQQAAAAWLFFLHMPPLIRHLARLSFLAQQLLLPPLDSKGCVAKAISAPAPKLSLTDHYNGRQRGTWQSYDTGRRGSDGEPAIALLSTHNQLPDLQGVMKGSVDQYYSQDDGVWYPDDLQPCLAYRGSRSPADGALAGLGYFDPWASLQAALVVEGFTEQLPGGDAALQWAMAQHGSGAATDAARGNLALARQEQRPDWISKPGFLALGTLRAYPLTQLRQLAVALRERSLPLGRPAVATLLRQLLYHVGSLTDADEPALLWRADWDEPHGTLSTLCRELSGLAAELEQSPREFASVGLLGEAAGYLSAWHPPLAAVARRFATAAAAWADALEEAAASAPPDEARAVRAKQCALRQVALLCTPARGGADAPLKHRDAAAMLEMAVLVHNGAVHRHGTALEAHIAEQQVRCYWMLARHADALTAAALSRPDMLTAALRRVLHRAPADIGWRQVACAGGDSGRLAGSFRAAASDGHLYSINLLDGTVLEDGVPPGRLPSEVREHQLYRRCFGSWDFEVSSTPGGSWRAVAAVRGRFYDFWLLPGGGLRVVEEEGASDGGGGVEGTPDECVPQRRRCLELLDPGEGFECSEWGGELPLRLRECYSHWLCREDSAIVLRLIHFLERTTHFLLAWRTPPSRPPKQGVEYDCRRVPPHLTSVHWAQLLPGGPHRGQLTDRLVLHSSAVVKVLAKFEDPKFVQTYVPAPDSGKAGSSSSSGAAAYGRGAVAAQHQLLFELPRYSLQFELRSGELRSLDYAGRCLAPCQQLFSDANTEGGGRQSGRRRGRTGQPPHSPTGRGPHAAFYTLPDFSKYLLLQPSATAAPGLHGSGLLMLVPAGRVRLQQPSGQVLVEPCGAASSAASLKAG